MPLHHLGFNLLNILLKLCLYTERFNKDSSIKKIKITKIKRKIGKHLSKKNLLSLNSTQEMTKGKYKNDFNKCINFHIITKA